MPSVIEQLAAYATNESFEKLPDAAVRAARQAILDTLGVMLAGVNEATASRVRALVAHRRSSGEAAIAGTGLRTSVEDAAFANGTAAHALDYDDLQSSLNGHPSAPILAAALAVRSASARPARRSSPRSSSASRSRRSSGAR